MKHLLDSVETEEELRKWKEDLSSMYFSEPNVIELLIMAWEKEGELGIREKKYGQAKTPFDDAVIPLSGYEDVILSSFQSQKDGTETTDNDCTEAAMAMLMTMVMTKYDSSSKGIRYADLARFMDEKFNKLERFYRFPAESNLPGVTPAFGANTLLNDLGRTHELGWTAELSANNTTADLLQNIIDGNPTMIYGSWAKNEPHAIVPVGYDKANDKWIVLDPGRNPTGTQKVYEEWPTQALLDFWHENRFWEFPIFRHETMITLYPNP
jgi:hypothetical protein